MLFLRKYTFFDQYLVANKKRIESRNAESWIKIENEICLVARQYWRCVRIVEQHIRLDTKDIESEDRRYEIAQKNYARWAQRYQRFEQSIDQVKLLCDIIYKRIERPPYWG